MNPIVPDIKFKMLTMEQLKRLNTRRLLGVLNAARAVEQHIININLVQHSCCEICKEYMGSDFQKDCMEPAKHFTEYKKRVKELLAAREHIK